MPRKATRKATSTELLAELVAMLRAEIESSKPAMLTIPEAADELRTSTDTVRRMIRSETIEAHKLRGQWRIPRREVEKIVANGRALPAARTSSKRKTTNARTRTKGARR